MFSKVWQIYVLYGEKMYRLIDYSSRFRILKGGKVSLVVSALLGGAVIASASPSGGSITSGSVNIVQSGAIFQEILFEGQVLIENC